MDFANTLKNLRKLHNITQEQLAESLQISRSTIAGYETKNHQPDYEKLEQFSRFFDVPIDFLLTGEPFIPKEYEIDIPVNELELEHEMIITYKTLRPGTKKCALKYLKYLQTKEDE